MNRRLSRPVIAPSARRKPVGCRRRATIYVLVLGTTLAVTLIGLSALMAARISLRMVTDQRDAAEARELARSGIEYARWIMSTDTDWRKRASPADWLNRASFGNGVITVSVVDPGDGDLADDNNDDATVTSTGEVGASRYAIAVQLTPEPPPGVASLSSAAAAGLGLTTTARVTADGPLSSNSAVTISVGSTVNANIESIAPPVILGTLNGKQTLLEEAKDTPGANAFAPYIAMGSALNIAAIPISGGGRELSGLLGPCANPYGATNAKGIYYVYCTGQILNLKNLRVLGTLVILDPGAGSGAGQGVLIEHADATYPALMVRGNFELKLTGNLAESKGVNLNPTGCEYVGVADKDETDTYPVGISGIVFASGALTTSTALTASGALISDGFLTIGGDLTMDHDPTLIDAPPPGFERKNRPMIPVAGTWQRVVN